MFAYCGNNPITCMDFTGMSWKKVGAFFSNAWNKIKTTVKNTFGAGSSTTATISKTEVHVIPDPSPITAKTGTQITKKISAHGDSSKPVSVYADKDLEHPIISSSAGMNININNFTFALSLGLDDFSVSGSLTNNGTIDRFGIKLNLSELKIGIEGSSTVTWDNNAKTNYTNVSVSGWAIVVAYALISSGQYVPSPVTS